MFADKEPLVLTPDGWWWGAARGYPGRGQHGDDGEAGRGDLVTRTAGRASWGSSPLVPLSVHHRLLPSFIPWSSPVSPPQPRVRPRRSARVRPGDPCASADPGTQPTPRSICCPAARPASRAAGGQGRRRGAAPPAAGVEAVGAARRGTFPKEGSQAAPAPRGGRALICAAGGFSPGTARSAAVAH